MTDFPEPGPRRAATSAPVEWTDADTARAERRAENEGKDPPPVKYDIRGRPTNARPSPTPPPTPAPVPHDSDGCHLDDSGGVCHHGHAGFAVDASCLETENPVAIGLGEDMEAFEAEDGEREIAGDLPTLSAEPRKSRFHANATKEKDERRFDTTALHFDKHGRLMSHADYIAHCEKYDYAWRSIKRGDRILDVGCGTDAPLMRAINFVQSQAAKVLDREGGCYVGVDMNKLKETKIAWAQLLGELDMTSDEGYDACLAAANRGVDPDGLMRGYTMVVCLEVIEHMGVEDGKAMLENMRDLLSPGGRIILSTPVYDGQGQARNHIHEYYVQELQELIESVGLEVKLRMGTFTSEPTLRRWLKDNRPDWLALYDEARQFHSSGYMSGVIAPMVPDISRNNVWVLEAAS